MQTSHTNETVMCEERAARGTINVDTLVSALTGRGRQINVIAWSHWEGR